MKKIFSLKGMVIILAGVSGCMALFCIAVTLAAVISPSATPTFSYAAAVSYPTYTPGPTNTPAPTSTPIYWDPSKTYPTPYPDLYALVLSNKKSMTDYQYQNFLNTIIGDRVHLKGKISEVHADGYVQLSPVGGGFFDNIDLYGLPQKMLLQLNKDQIIEFEATIQDYTTFILFTVNLHDPVVFSVR